MKITNIGNGKIAITSPYNPTFVSRIKKAGGKWDGTSKTWVCDERTIEAVRSIMREVYGQDDHPQELVNVKVTMSEDGIGEYHGPIVLFGRAIASAWGRDSGARIGDGVGFEKGGCESGGSAKNWKTIIKGGSVFTIFDVPKAAVENKLGWDDSYGKFEIVSPDDPSAVLKAEKEALLKRIAEIDEELVKLEGKGCESIYEFVAKDAGGKEHQISTKACTYDVALQKIEKVCKEQSLTEPQAIIKRKEGRK